MEMGATYSDADNNQMNIWKFENVLQQFANDFGKCSWDILKSTVTSPLLTRRDVGDVFRDLFLILISIQDCADVVANLDSLEIG